MTMLALEQTGVATVGDECQRSQECNRDQYRNDGNDLVVEQHIGFIIQFAVQGNNRVKASG